MRTAIVQHDVCWHDAAATRAHIEPRIVEAAASGAQLVVLTEMFATGFSMHTDVMAEPRGGATEQWLIQQAESAGVWLIGSIAQWDDDRHDRAVNVAVLASPDGFVHRYEKIHPFSFAREDRFYRPGDKTLTVDIDGVRTSIFICYDLRFADEFWALAHDTDCYLVLASWPAARREHWRALLRARAIENQAYVVGANRVGMAQDISHAGDSVFLDPLGRELVEAGPVETIISADIRAETVREVRQRFPFLNDRREGQPS